MKHLIKLEEFTKAIADDRLVVVDFYAQWCGPCKLIAPLLEELAEKYKKDAVFYKVDIEKADEEVIVEITAMPTFIFYRNGEQLELFQGANANKLRETVEKLIVRNESSDSESSTN